MAQITIAQSLAKSFANKLKVTDSNIKDFENALNVLNQVIKNSPEYVETDFKIPLANFFKNSFKDIASEIEINSKEKHKIDLVIKEKGITSVLFELKGPNVTSTTDMCQEKDINKKALQQLIYYYLKERKVHKNYGVKHLTCNKL